MNKTRLAYQNFRVIFRDYRYVLLSTSVALLYYALNVFTVSPHDFFYGFSHGGVASGMMFIISLLVGFHMVVLPTTFVTMLILSVLFGVLVSLVLYKTRFARSMSTERTNVIASAGVFLGVIAPGCAACGVGLLSALGFGAAFATFLPYDGLELSIAAIVFLSYAVHHFAATATSCSIPAKKS